MIETAPAPAPTPTKSSARRGDPLRRRLLVAADVVTVSAAAFVLASWEGLATSLWALTFLPGWLVLAKLHGLYDRDHRALRHLTVDEFPNLLFWAGTGTVATDVVVALTPSGALGVTGAVAFASIVIGLGSTLRMGARALWRRLTPAERSLVVGTGALAAMTRRKLQLFTDIHVEVVEQRDEVPGDPELDLEGVDRVIVATDSVDEELVGSLLEQCRRASVKFSLIPPAGAFGTAVALTRVADLPVVEYNTWEISRSTLLLKRVVDVLVSTVLLVLLAPLMLLVALAVAVTSRAHPVFVQRRAGRDGRTFRMLKFRTMVPDAEQRLGEVVSLDELSEPMFKLERDPRVTRLGSLLRHTSLDELPQLVNVLNGDMSLVGPRPEQVELVERYEPQHRFRLLVKPGLTGPMQVHGRGQLTFEERLAVERDYIENLSVGRDLRILAMTLTAVVSGRGAY